MVVFAYIGSESLGICQLSAMLKEKGIEHKLAFEPSLFDDTKFLHIPAIPKLMNYNKKYADYIISLKPKILAFGVLTMNYMWALDIARRVKAELDVKTVFGGIHVQALPEHVLSNPEVDYIMKGEGDFTFPRLVESILDGNPDTSIGGLGYKKGSELQINPVDPVIPNLDDLPFANRDLFAPYEDFSMAMNFVAGRGCPFRCTFCDSPMQKKQFDSPQKFVRYRSVDKCFEELKLLKEKFNPKNFHIVDDVFTFDKKWMKEWCERYPEEIGTPFQVTGYPSTMTEEKVVMLKAAGCMFLQVGIQSLDQENRKNILDRHESNEDIGNTIDWCKKHDLPISIDYIFFPWEANEKVQVKAARFFQEHPPSRLATFYFSYLPGTPIVSWAIKNGYLKEEATEDIRKGVNAYYHAGGEYGSQQRVKKFYNNFFIFFALMTIVPYRFAKVLFRVRAYRYARFFPKIPLLILKEYVFPFISSSFKISPSIKAYRNYYLKNFVSFVQGVYR
jgi:anaerobic magnesium-protoporphyrin IX monomethyl ester cyclase